MKSFRQLASQVALIPGSKGSKEFLDSMGQKVIDYPVKQKQEGLPFHDTNIKSRQARRPPDANAVSEEVDLDEGLRLIKHHEGTTKSAKVYWDNEWGEHRVKFYRAGVHQKDADYHTDDSDDAHKSAKHFIKEDEINDGGFLTELSRRTLSNYVKRAHISGTSAAANAENAFKNKNRNKLVSSNITGEKREQGINRAAKRLAHEGVESEEQFNLLNEAQQVEHSSYMQKAHTDSHEDHRQMAAAHDEDRVALEGVHGENARKNRTAHAEARNAHEHAADLHFNAKEDWKEGRHKQALIGGTRAHFATHKANVATEKAGTPSIFEENSHSFKDAALAENTEQPIGYHVIDIHTKAVVGKAKSRKRANSIADRKDLAYGAIKHHVKAIWAEKTVTEEVLDEAVSTQARIKYHKERAKVHHDMGRHEAGKAHQTAADKWQAVSDGKVAGDREANKASIAAAIHTNNALHDEDRRRLKKSVKEDVVNEVFDSPSKHVNWHMSKAKAHRAAGRDKLADAHENAADRWRSAREDGTYAAHAASDRAVDQEYKHRVHAEEVSIEESAKYHSDQSNLHRKEHNFKGSIAHKAAASKWGAVKCDETRKQAQAASVVANRVGPEIKPVKEDLEEGLGRRIMDVIDPGLAGRLSKLANGYAAGQPKINRISKTAGPNRNARKRMRHLGMMKRPTVVVEDVEIDNNELVSVMLDIVENNTPVELELINGETIEVDKTMADKVIEQFNKADNKLSFLDAISANRETFEQFIKGDE